MVASRQHAVAIREELHRRRGITVERVSRGSDVARVGPHLVGRSQVRRGREVGRHVVWGKLTPELRVGGIAVSRGSRRRPGLALHMEINIVGDLLVGSGLVNVPQDLGTLAVEVVQVRIQLSLLLDDPVELGLFPVE